MDIRNQTLVRVYALLLGLIVPAALLLFYQTITISVIRGDTIREQGATNYVKYLEIKPDRGDILSDDGSVLATSIPYFDIYFDPIAPSDADFKENLDSLAFCLANFVDRSYTVGGYRQRLLEWRNDTIDPNRHVLIRKGVSFAEKRKIEQFPLFNLGQYRGGVIVHKRSDRRRPFGLMAQRTIGYVRESAMPVGLEGYFDEYLKGEPGGQFAIKVDNAKNLWMPLDDLTAIDPTSGDDLITTIDVNMQDVVENALLRAMNSHNAEWGTAMVMDVESGAIKAIANLGRYREGWWEIYNNAVGKAIEPGSTFKTASMLALLEDGYAELQDTVFINRGETQFYDKTMKDSSPESFETDTATVRRVFEISSNVGIAKLVNKHYGQRDQEDENSGAAQFINRLKQFNLHLPTDIEIKGEAAPYIKEAYSSEDNWSGTTLPWMSIGYELQLTPLQLLTFYNAIANDGQMMKPYLVSEIRDQNRLLEEFKPTVVKRQIASKQSIRRIKELLRGVVDSGTAAKLNTEKYNFAGKTGTAQINYTRISDETQIGGYQASFVGYFPAENPRYTCIVVINDPQKNGFYGGEVAGPVFREIADKIYATQVGLHQPVNQGPRPVLAENDLPQLDIGQRQELEQILAYVGLPYMGRPSTELVSLRPVQDTLKLQDRPIDRHRVPSVFGMNLRDALYVLENRGLKVKVKGYGKVANQSIKVGTPIRGQTITLTLQ